MKKLFTRKNRIVKACVKATLFFSAFVIRNKRFSNNKKLIDYVFKVNTFLPRLFFYPLTPDQDKAEVQSLLEKLEKRSLKNVLEVGTGFGGMTFLFSKLVAKNGKLFTVDSGTNELHRYFLQHLIVGKKLLNVSLNSHNSKTLEIAENFFQGERIDLLYIDGDHTFSSVLQDYEFYSSLIAKDGLIVFHDIADSKLDVSKFWSTLPLENRTEILGHNFIDKYGTGVLTVQ